MELTTTGTGAGSGTIELIGILPIGCFIPGEGAAVIPCVLVLYTGLIGDNRVTGRVEGLTVQ